MRTKHEALSGLIDSAVNRRQFAHRVLAAGAMATGAAVLTVFRSVNRACADSVERPIQLKGVGARPST